MDGDNEIDYSGLIQSVMGITDTTHPYVPHIPDSWLKIGEVGISAGHCVASLRSYTPDKVPTPMAAPKVGLTDLIKVYVNPFRGHLASNNPLHFSGGFSPAFEPPGVSGMQRIDLLVLNRSAELEIIHGSEVLSPTRPSAPDYPVMQMPIAEVLLQDMDDSIRQDMVSDIRPHFVWPGVASSKETRWFSASDFWSLRGPQIGLTAGFASFFPVIYFNDSTEESVYNSWRLPHRINTETGLTVIISWANVNGGGAAEAAKWGIEYAYADLCDGITPSMVAGLTGYCVCVLSACGGLTTWVRHDAPIALSTLGLTPGGILGFRIFRDVTDPEDDLTGEAAFMGAAFEWEGYAQVDRTMIYA